MNITICPLASSGPNGYMPCRNDCALYINNEKMSGCAITKSVIVQDEINKKLDLLLQNKEK